MCSFSYTIWWISWALLIKFCVASKAILLVWEVHLLPVGITGNSTLYSMSDKFLIEVINILCLANLKWGNMSSSWSTRGNILWALFSVYASLLNYSLCTTRSMQVCLWLCPYTTLMTRESGVILPVKHTETVLLLHLSVEIIIIHWQLFWPFLLLFAYETPEVYSRPEMCLIKGS